jgi:hypothetical protein
MRTTEVTPPPEPHPGAFDPPAILVEPNKENRLIPALRAAAQTKSAQAILGRAAAAFYWIHNPSEFSMAPPGVNCANALADLAVTGREAYKTLNGFPLDDPAHRAIIAMNARANLTAAGVHASASALDAALDAAFDRAFAVAWALRGPAAQRAALRAPLGWVAVSAEDDTAHRPVNVEGSPYEQYEIPVTAGGFTVATSSSARSRSTSSSARTADRRRWKSGARSLGSRRPTTRRWLCCCS